MIQINLIPDIKAEFLKAEKLKTMVVAISVITSVALLVVTAAMYSYANFAQPAHTENLQEDIDNLVTELKTDSTAVKAVTVNNQLKVLPGLHEDRPAAHRLTGYLAKLVPASVKIDTMIIDFDDNEIVIEGSAEGNSKVASARNANIFVDTIKNANYTDRSIEDFSPVNAFSDVSIESIRTSSDDGNITTFEMRFSFEAAIFDSTVNAELNVPSLSSDDTRFGQGAALFEAKPEVEDE